MEDIRIKLYRYNESGYFTCEVTETNAAGPININDRWTDAPVPEIPEGKYAFFNGSKWDWEIRDFYVDPNYIPPALETPANTAPPNVI